MNTPNMPNLLIMWNIYIILQRLCLSFNQELVDVRKGGQIFSNEFEYSGVTIHNTSWDLKTAESSSQWLKKKFPNNYRWI